MWRLAWKGETSRSRGRVEEEEKGKELMNFDGENSCNVVNADICAENGILFSKIIRIF